MDNCPQWFDRKWLLGQFGKTTRTAIRNYMEFVSDGVQQASPWTAIKNQIYLGSDEFVSRIQKMLPEGRLTEVPQIQQLPVAKTLEEYEKIASSRNEAIILAYRSGAYSLREIGVHYSLHYSTISRIIHARMQE